MNKVVIMSKICCDFSFYVYETLNVSEIEKFLCLNSLISNV